MKKKISTPIDFDNPTKLPKNDIEAKDWQDKNIAWWESHPMRYDWKTDLGFDDFSGDYYLEIDKRFFSNAKIYMPYKRIPFDPLIPFSELHDKTVLEIGIGCGSHAQLLAQHAKTYTGIDITDYAVTSASKRMKLSQLNAKIIRMDAEDMDFKDDTFDFIWSWGVIHHSSNPENILKEMQRVLRPGGMAVTMVYHRSFWNYYFMHGLIRGVILGDLLKTRSLYKTVQKHTDGAIARYYTPSEWSSIASRYFAVNKIQIFGSKAELVPLPGGSVKNLIMQSIPNKVSRFFTNQVGLGSFLVSTLKKN